MAETTKTKKRGYLTSIAEMFLPSFPDLKKKLLLADIKQTPSEFMEKVVLSSAYLTVILLILSYLVLSNGMMIALQIDMPMFFVYLLLPIIVIPPVVFAYFMLYPDASIIRRRKELDYETLFAGRHLVISLRSGMPLFEAMVGATNGYGAVSKEINKIVDKVVLGVPMTHAIREVAHYNPSKYFTRILMQISNSLSSGSDVGESLESVLSQISKEQMIALKEYSQKLTPIVMFYMVFGIIVPSLGVVLATVVFSAISGGSMGLTSNILVPIFLLITIIQFLFLGILESSRPKYII